MHREQVKNKNGKNQTEDLRERPEENWYFKYSVKEFKKCMSVLLLNFLKSIIKARRDEAHKKLGNPVILSQAIQP